MKVVTSGSLLATLLLCAALTAPAQVSVGLKAGVSLATVRFEYTGNYPDEADAAPSSILAPAGGLLLNARFGNVALQPALLYARKGYREKESYYFTSPELSISGSSDLTTHLHYVEVPVNLVYTTCGDHGFQLLAGPYVALGVSGRTKGRIRGTISETYTLPPDGVIVHRETDSTEVVNDKVVFGRRPDQLKRFDFGLNVGAGYLMRRVQVQVSYSLGLVNMYNSGGSYRAANHVVQASVAYLFGNE